MILLNGAYTENKKSQRLTIINEEQDLKLADLDYLTGNRYLQMIKAALPYMEVPEQRMFFAFVRMSELQGIISFFRDEEVATMGICSLEHQDKRSPVEMLKAIKPYVSTAGQEIVGLIDGSLRGGRTPMASMFQDSGGFGGRDTLFPAAQLSEQQGQGQTLSVMPEGEIPDSEIPPSRTPGPPPQHNSSLTVPGAVGSHPVLNQIKGFLSPERQPRIEMVQVIIQAMQQFT